MTYNRTFLVGSYPPAEKQSVYSVAPANWAIELLVLETTKTNKYIEAIIVHVSKRIDSNSSTIENTDNLSPLKSLMYIHLNVYKQRTDVKLLLLHSNTWNTLHYACKGLMVNIIIPVRHSWNHLIESKKWAQPGLRMSWTKRVNKVYIYIYIYRERERAQNLNNHSCPKTELRKFLTDNTTILEHQNSKQKLQILEAQHIKNMQPIPNRINFQTSSKVLKCL